jgi:hypothetical protein
VQIEAAGAAGCITFTALRPNTPGVTTELLLQSLPSRHRRTYDSRYRVQGFHAFSEAEPTVEVPADPGWHAPAYRFVNTATGQTTPLLPLAKVLVS